jgi:bifunctional non-homologous end joining protein LigD
MLRTLPAGFIVPCLPTKTDRLPSGSQWLHEIKHDGFRIIARKDGDRVRLYSRPGNDMTRRFPLIAEALTGVLARTHLHRCRNIRLSSAAANPLSGSQY